MEGGPDGPTNLEYRWRLLRASWVALRRPGQVRGDPIQSRHRRAAAPSTGPSPSGSSPRPRSRRCTQSPSSAPRTADTPARRAPLSASSASPTPAGAGPRGASSAPIRPFANPWRPICCDVPYYVTVKVLRFVTHLPCDFGGPLRCASREGVAATAAVARGLGRVQSSGRGTHRHRTCGLPRCGLSLPAHAADQVEQPRREILDRLRRAAAVARQHPAEAEK